ncbi:MAG: metallophosphoesterase [Myxococcales bacterium]|nr:metallophosphoesterase [Myxococcales bacterium]
MESRAAGRARRRGGATSIEATLAHLSDLHVTPIRVRGLGDVANKRVLGWLSWLRRRRHEHRSEILDALLEDLERTAPDHVAVTGDLTNVGLADEIEGAVPWLARMGGPERVSIVPGNHDAYAAPVDAARFASWAPYLRGDADEADELRFPSVKRVAGLTLIGLSSARPTPPGFATGALGDAQLARLDALLATPEVGGPDSGPRVVLIHHPPVPAGQSARRRLSDGEALREVFARHGVELVIHGHTHRTSFESVAGPNGPIPVIGVPSSSARGAKPGRRARYHLYRFTPAADGSSGARFRIVCQVRALAPDATQFSAAEEHVL